MARNNLCSNPALKNDLTGWFVDRGTRSTTLTAMARTTGFSFQGNGYAVGPEAPALAGQTFTVSCEVRSAVAGPIGVSFDHVDAGSGFLQNTSAETVVAANTTTRISVTGVMAAGAFGIVPVCSTYPNNQSATITAFLIEQTGTAGAYFDGDSPSATWDGASGNSTSTLDDGVAHTRALTDALGATDSASRAQVAQRALTDPVGTGDSTGRAQIATRGLTDAVGTTDTAAAGLAAARTVLDVIGAADTATAGQGHGRTVTDPIGTTDAAAGVSAVLIERSIVDAIGTTDAASSTHAATRAVADALGVADTASAAQGATRGVVDAVGLADTATGENVGTAHQRTVTDALGLVDAAARAQAVERALVDPLGLGDTASASAAGVDHTRTLADAIGLGDTATRAQTAARAVTDPLGLADTATRARGVIRALVDAVGLADSRTAVNGPLIGVPFLPRLLGLDARLAVEIAWGADVTAAEGTWAWTDVTADVRQDPGISTGHGRADEAATTQPATCTLVLDNTAARYSLGGHSPNWPNVRRGVPVRVRIDPDGAGWVTLFLGYADGFTPTWNVRGNVREARLSASGTLRRLDQGAPVVASALRRSLTMNPSVLAYWPLEDGKNAELAAAVVGGDMRYVGRPGFAESSVFDCSAELPTLSGATLFGEVPPYTPTGEIQLRFLVDIPSDGATDDTPLIGLTCTGTGTTWEIRYETGTVGTARVRCYDRFGNILLAQGISAGLDGFRGQLGLQLRQVGADVEWDIDFLRVGASASAGFGAVLAGRTIGAVTSVNVNGAGGNDSVTIGHVAVYDANTPETENVSQVNAYAGEFIATLGTAGRISRLTAENGVAFTLVGAAEGTESIVDYMGPQRVSTLLELLREAEAVGQGLLYDGHTAGLTFATRRAKENQAPALVLDAGAAELAPVFAPVDDDQRTRNKVTVTRTGGVSAVAEDVDGPLGTASVGTYDTSEEVNTWLDRAVPLYAGWFLAQGTQEGYRYPSVSVDLLATPQHARAVLALRPGQRVDLVDVPGALPGHPDGSGTISLIVEGVSHDIGPGTWTATIASSSYAPWRIAVTADDAGDTDPLVMRADTDGSTTTAARAAGATTLPVFTGVGPVWTTAADDYPLMLDVGGIAVRATACTAGSSQTFTVDPLPIARPSGTPVAVWDPPRLGL